MCYLLTLRGKYWNHFDLYSLSSREGGFPNACVTHWYTSPEVGLSNLHSQHWRRKSVRLYVTKFKKRCIFNCDRICWSQTEFFVCFCWTYWYGKTLFVSLPSDLLFCHKTWWAIQKKVLLHVLLRNNLIVKIFHEDILVQQQKNIEFHRSGSFRLHWLSIQRKW